MKIEWRPADALIEYARNARVHSDAQIDLIGRSMLEYGFTNPVLITNKGVIAAGHGRVLAARRLWLNGESIPGCKRNKVPCIDLGELNDAQLARLVLADNKIALNAGWDEAMLRSELLALSETDLDLGITGFSAEEIAQSLTWAPPMPPKAADPDAVPGAEPICITKPGDLWLLGPHRLLCGDATKLEDLKTATDGAPVACIWTDPPYNVAYEGAAGSIQNDSMDGAAFARFLTQAFTAMHAVLAEGASIYIAHSDTEGLTFRAAFRASGFKLSGCLIWRKDSLVLGRSDYQWQHEPILYGWKKGAPHRWFGGRKQTTLIEFGDDALQALPDGRWQVKVGDRVLLIEGGARVEEIASSVMSEPRPRSSAEHPTMKPVALIERMLANSCKAGDLVCDPFSGSGSGSVLVASERLSMRCAAVELEPKFCDVIVRRWQQFTGNQATLARGGKRFNDLATGGGVKGDDARQETQAQPPETDHGQSGTAPVKRRRAKARGGTPNGASAPVG